MVGIEPTLPSGNTILSRGRLPVPPHRHVNYLVLSDHLHTRGNWRDAVEGYSLIIFAETQIYQGLQLIRKTFTHWILSPLRLPIPSQRRLLPYASVIIQHIDFICQHLKSVFLWNFDRFSRIFISIIRHFTFLYLQYIPSGLPTTFFVFPHPRFLGSTNHMASLRIKRYS
jgi:hypothetical protein